MAKTNKTCYTIIATTIIFLALSNALAQTKNAGEIKLNLTSDKKSLYPGEKIKLNITIENKGEYIHRLDFTAKIRYYGIPVESTERYSDRGFMKDKPQTLQDEEKIPYFAPPGEYEIIFKIEDHDVVKTEKIHVRRTTQHYIIAMLLVLTPAIIYLRRYIPPLKPKAGVISIKLKTSKTKNALKKFTSKLSIGQKFILASIILLAITAALTIYPWNLPEKTAVIAYLCIFFGVMFLLIEEVKK